MEREQLLSLDSMKFIRFHLYSISAWLFLIKRNIASDALRSLAKRSHMTEEAESLCHVSNATTFMQDI